MRWLLLLATVTVAEIVGLWQVGLVLGFWPTIGVILVTGALGASLAQREGLRVWREWNDAMQQGKLPTVGLVDGLLVLLGGVFLMAPGFLGDITGLLLLFPPTRRLVAALVRAQVARRLGSLDPASFLSPDASGFSSPEGQSQMDPTAGFQGFRVIRFGQISSPEDFFPPVQDAERGHHDMRGGRRLRDDRDIVVVDTTGESLDEPPALLALPAAPTAASTDPTTPTKSDDAPKKANE